MKKLKSKFLTLGVIVAVGLLLPVTNVFADDGENTPAPPESDNVPVILRAEGDANFLNISLINTGELIFNDINHYSNHNNWINPQGGNIVDLVIDSSKPWTLAIEGTNFIGIDNPEEVIGLNRLRTRVQRAVLPNGQVIYTNSLTNASNSSGAGLTGNQIGASDAYRNLATNGRQQMVNTNRVGRNFTYRMQYQFQGNRDIAEGEYRGSIRYAIWQR